MAEHGRACPYDRANVFSKITFWWMNALFKLGVENELTEDNICDVPEEDRSCKLESKLKRYWKEEVQRHSEGGEASLYRAVLKAFKWQWLLPGLMVLAFESIKIAQPFLIGELVRYLNNAEDAVSKTVAFCMGAALGLSSILMVTLNPTYFFTMQHIALRMKVAVGALIYRKVLSLSTEAFHYTSSGQIVNHLSTDIEKFNEAIDLLHFFWASPLSVITVIYLLYRQLGLACFWGLLVIVVIVPVQAGLSALLGRLRTKIGALSDHRIQLMSEVIVAMRVIKMQCWEQPFQELISKIRGDEMRTTRVGAAIWAFNYGVEQAAMKLMLAVFIVVAWVKGESFATSTAFVVFGLCQVLKSTAFFFLSFSIGKAVQLQASLSRVQTFLLLNEEKETIKDLRLHRSIQQYNEPNADWAVDIDHMTARWPLIYTEGRRRFQRKGLRSSTSSTKSLLRESDIDQAFSLKYISLQIKKGEHIAVVGVVGSGKSSLLMSLIGELPHEIGQISMNGRVSYCSQTTWVFSGSVRENILFGQSFDSSRYRAVVEACGLARDLELLPKGDQTFVGERGLQLSGGQKARLTLARSIYHGGDIILMDDPLSAVDTNVGRHIFQRCIVDLLADKTVILVTHQLQYLKQVDRIVVLRDGCIHDVGTYTELKSRGTDMRVLTSTDEHPGHATEAALEAEEESKQHLLLSKCLEKQAAESEETEKVLRGAVGLHVYWDYFCAGYGPALLPLLLPLWLAGPAFFCFSDWMLAKWLDEQDSHNSTSASSSTRDWANMSGNMRWYIIALMASTGCYLLFSVSYLQMAITAAKRLHDRMLQSMLHTVSRFFDVHPVGQILNRFSRDLYFVDDSVSILGFVVAMQTTQFLGFFLMTVVVNPWMTIAFFLLMLSIVIIRVYALRTMRQVKRLEAKGPKSGGNDRRVNTLNTPLPLHIWYRLKGKLVLFLTQSQANSALSDGSDLDLDVGESSDSGDYTLTLDERRFVDTIDREINHIQRMEVIGGDGTESDDDSIVQAPTVDLNAPAQWIADPNGFVPQEQLQYTRRETGQEQGLAHRVVKDLVEPFHHTGMRVYMGNFCTGVPLLRDLEVCGMVRSNRKFLPADLLPKKVQLQKHEYKTAQAGHLTFSVWLDTSRHS
ncbi:hypothetical protein RRG08_054673 [Elysia crispata]|uniref:Uncharacterized protein n=2 Tax=Elysia crispata TaxID=231223 RepID=A0AAE1B0P7_9GAST|nr:hypothetical protein RRG08_054673 [Elysia crispata]